MSNGVALSDDISMIQSSVDNLSANIKKAGINWKDHQFDTLRANISDFAKASKRVTEVGKKCERAIQNFKKIESM